MNANTNNANWNDLTDRRDIGESNGLANASAYHDHVTRRIKEKVRWDDPRLARITRLRLLSDPGFPFWDISYCHGELRNGEPVDVMIPTPTGQLPKKGMRKHLVELAKRDGVYAKGLGVFDAISTLC